MQHLQEAVEVVEEVRNTSVGLLQQGVSHFQSFCSTLLAGSGAVSERNGTIPFDQDSDVEEVIKAFFDEIDFDRNGLICRRELEAIVDKYKGEKEFTNALMNIFNPSPDVDNGIDFATFKKAISDIPRPRGQRVQWSNALRLDCMLAKHLKLGHFFDELKGIREMTDLEIDQACNEFISGLKALLKDKVNNLRSGSLSSTATEANSKFCMDGAFQGNFAMLDKFYEGPEALIGSPNPNILMGMRKEHVQRSNADVMFVTTNYNVTTCPRWEWMFVVDPSGLAIRYPHTPFDKKDWTEQERVEWKGNHGRDIVPLSNFLSHPMAMNASLKEPEVIGLRLYTGPMFNLYNAVLRKFPFKVFDDLKGNHYETTIFVICSGIAKLSKVTEIPATRLLYRGLGGMILPEQFWKASNGFRGAVEWGLMSTTTNRDVAIQYSGLDKKRGTIFEITCGRIDIGAVLVWISQYPGEAEYLFAPLSCLEVTGEPRVEAAGAGEIVIFPLRVNMCLKGLSLEQIIERRKNLHLAMVKNAREELEHEVTNNFVDFENLVRLRSVCALEIIDNTDPSDVELNPEEATFELKCNHNDAVTAGAPFIMCSSGRLYFEVEVLAGTEQFWVGFAGSSYFKGLDRSFWNERCWVVNARTGRAGHNSMWLQLKMNGCQAVGDIAGVALDLHAGSMLLSRNGDFDAPNGGTVFEAGIAPGSDVGSYLFPIMTGTGTDSKYRVNFGHDPGWPLKFLPDGYQGVASAALSAQKFCLTAQSLLGEFEEVANGHRSMDSAHFNDDGTYKSTLSEILELKDRLINKQQTLMLLWAEGATAQQIQQCCKAPAKDFELQRLKQECPLYCWKSILSGWCSYCADIVVPIQMPPCQTALIWEAILRAGTVKTIRLGDVTCNLSDLVPSLDLKASKLHYEKYERAIVGLVAACATLAEAASSVISTPFLTAIDCHGIEFTNDRALQLADTIAMHKGMETINGVGGLQLSKHSRPIVIGGRPPFPFQGLFFSRIQEGANLRECLAWEEQASLQPLGRELNNMHWTFVMERVAAYGWSKLDLSGNDLDCVAVRSLSHLLGKVVSLTELDLSENRFGLDGATALAGSLGKLLAIQTLKLNGCQLEIAGWQAIVCSLEPCTQLAHINSFSVSGLFSGELAKLKISNKEAGLAVSVAAHLQRCHNTITLLDFSSNNLDAEPATLISKQLGLLTCLETLSLANNLLRSEGAKVLAPALCPLLGLQNLSLSSNELGSDGAKGLASSLGNLTSLLALDLNFNRIGSQAACELAETALKKLTSLTMLMIGGNRLDSSAVLAIARNVEGHQQLKRLELGFKGRLGGINSELYNIPAAQECKQVLARLGEWNRSSRTGLYMD